MRGVNSIEWFIKKARQIHGDKYDLSLVEYKGCNHPIRVVCGVHGEFETTPRAFFTGYGCPKCGIKDARNKKFGPFDSADKECGHCHERLPRTNEYFYICDTKPDGLMNVCKSCSKEISAAWGRTHRQESNEYFRKYKRGNPKILEANRKWIRENRDKYNEIRRRSINKRREVDLEFCISVNLRSAVYGALKRDNAAKAGRTEELIGCSIGFLKEYIEGLFQDGMSWGNYGFRGWHIDHIRPCASYDLTDLSQQRECFHYTNLQPLWWDENISKGSYYKGVRYRKKGNIKDCVTLR